jgi:secondary thiamine-phosphate synthase enzyme
MTQWLCIAQTIEKPTQAGVSVKDITPELQRLVEGSGIQTGTLNATCIGSTGALTTIECEPGAVQDLARAVNELAPQDREYEHEKAWQDGNGHSHVQAALLGPSLALPIRRARLLLGTWQQAVVINHDTTARTRRIEVTLIGTGEP